MNLIKLILVPLLMLAFFTSRQLPAQGDKELVVFVECRGDQGAFDVKSIVEKNAAFFKQRKIKVVYSKARGCGYLLAEGARMVKLDASLTEQELLDSCEKFFFPNGR